MKKHLVFLTVPRGTRARAGNYYFIAVLLSSLLLTACHGNSPKKILGGGLMEMLGKKSYPGMVSSSVAIHNGFVYFGTFNGVFNKVDLVTGELAWKIKTKGSVYSAPTFIDKNVYFSSFDNKLYALDSNGEILWTYDQGNYSGYPILNYEKKVLISIKAVGILAINSVDGKLIWKINQNPINMSTNAPTIQGDTLYVGNINGNATVAINGMDGKIIWHNEYKDCVISQIETGNGKNYLGLFNFDDTINSCIIALNRNTGKEIWKKYLKYNDHYKPLYCQGKVFFGTWDNKLYCLNAETGQEIWIKTFGKDGLGTNLTIINNKLYFGTYNRLFYVLDAANGSVLLSQNLDYGIFDAVLYRDSVYVGTGGGKLFKINK